MVSELIGEIRATHAAVVAVVVRDHDEEIVIDAGADPVDETSLFEVGSITKTVTGTLLAVLVTRAVVSLETTVGAVLGDAGNASAVTLLQLATHTAGLPRLAPNHRRIATDPANPYERFDAGALRDALAEVDVTPTDEPEYSNFGFQLLGHVLETAAGRPFGELVIDEVLGPVGCSNARCGTAEPGDHRVPGYDGGRETPRWTQPLGGAGAVELTPRDFARWMAANTYPASTPIADAIQLAQQVRWGDARTGRGLGWRHYNGGLIHNGGTGGFRSFCGLIPGLVGVGVLTNLGGWDAIDAAAIRHLTRVAREASASGE